MTARSAVQVAAELERLRGELLAAQDTAQGYQREIAAWRRYSATLHKALAFVFSGIPMDPELLKEIVGLADVQSIPTGEEVKAFWYSIRGTGLLARIDYLVDQATK